MNNKTGKFINIAINKYKERCNKSNKRYDNSKYGSTIADQIDREYKMEQKYKNKLSLNK